MNKDEFIDERECLGIDCAWCLNKECSLWIKDKNEEKQDDQMVQGQKSNY